MSCLREVQTISKSPDILPMPSLRRLPTGEVLNPLKNTTNTSHNKLLHQEPLQPPLEPRPSYPGQVPPYQGNPYQGGAYPGNPYQQSAGGPQMPAGAVNGQQAPTAETPQQATRSKHGWIIITLIFLVVATP